MIEDRIRDEGLLTFAEVEARLVEAMEMCWRLPDRERTWTRVRAYWPEMRRHNHFGDYADTDPDARPRALPLTRAEIGRMEEAFGWLDRIDPADRKLIGLAISALARGEARVPWRALLRPMGLARGADGLRKRYGRAMSRVVRAVNARPSACVA
jgi:hypothetical protein